MHERPEFEFPKPAPGHGLLLEKFSLARIASLTSDALRNETENMAWAIRVVRKTLWYLDKQSGNQDTIEMLAVRELKKYIPEEQIPGIFPEAARKGKELYDGCFIRVQEAENEARHPFFQQLLAPATPKKIETKKRRDYSKLNIKVSVPEDELRQTVLNGLLYNKPLFLRGHTEFEETFIKLVLSLGSGEIVPHSKVREVGVTPEFLEKYTITARTHCLNRLRHVSRF